MSAEGSLVTPAGYLAYLRAQGVPSAALEVAPVVLVGWSGVSRTLAKAAMARRRRGWPYDAEWPYHEAEGFGVGRLPTGAPAAAFLLDQLIACGARVLVTVGIAGSLVPDIAPGTVILAGEAIPGDGTSPHYAPSDGRPIPAFPSLTRRLAAALAGGGIEVRIGTTWTTDAPFRETPTAVERARERGGVAVDMEAAAVYALAARRRVAACAILIVTDGVWESWRPAFGSPEVGHALENVCLTLPLVAARLHRPAER